MKTFDYLRATSASEAVAASAAEGSVYLGGGTNLLDLMKGNVIRPDRLVDVTRLPGLDRIESLADGATRVGALVRNGDLAHDPHGQAPASVDVALRVDGERYARLWRETVTRQG